METFLVKKNLFGKMQESSEKQMTELVKNDEHIVSEDLFDSKTGLMKFANKEYTDTVKAYLRGCAREQKASFWDMVEEVKKSLSAKKTTGNVYGRLHCYPYEQLVMTPHNKKIFDELLKLGSIATVFDSETIDTYDKLKSVYKQLNDYMKDHTIKKQIQSAFIRKQNQLSH